MPAVGPVKPAKLLRALATLPRLADGYSGEDRPQLTQKA